MSTIENLKDKDPFAEVEDNDDTGVTTKKKEREDVHIRIQQRNGRKTLTTVQGVDPKFDKSVILKHFKKKFACNGNIVLMDKDKDNKDKERDPSDKPEKMSSLEKAKWEIIQLQGDQRKNVYEFLTSKKEGLGMDATAVKVHGF